ncbi:hypothetical protein H4S04_006581 [Coemansia sp. S16]|nr:hypothetical protein H4S04_006581 [Coemansia sp. S16]
MTSFVIGWSINVGRSLGMAARGWTEKMEGFSSYSAVYGRVLGSASSADIVFVGIIQLVPGSTGVRSFVSLLSEELSASSLTMSMLSTSISIAVGLLLSNGVLYSDHRRFKLGSF